MKKKKLIFFFYYFLENYSRRVCKSTNKKIWPYACNVAQLQSVHEKKNVFFKIRFMQENTLRR